MLCPAGTVLVKHTFIDIQCVEEENEPVMRRQKSDPLFSSSPAARLYHAISPKCIDGFKKALPEALTPTTCDECDTPASLPTTCDDDYDEDEVNMQGKSSFSFAEAVSFLDGDDRAVHEGPQDTSVADDAWELESYDVYGLPQHSNSWQQAAMGWGEQAPVLSTQQQLYQAEYQWTGDASSRIPMMSDSLMQNRHSQYMDVRLNDSAEASSISNSPSCNLGGNYYTLMSGNALEASQMSNNSLHSYYMQSKQVLDTSMLPQPPPPSSPPPAQIRQSNYFSVPTEEAVDATPTTLMVRNLPNDLSQPGLVEEFKAAGYGGFFDFVYMPMNFRGAGNFGYAFVNFISHETAIRFMEHAKTIEHGLAEDPQKWDAVWSTCQGLGANIERYRNSPLMHELVPKECKPALYDDTGSQVVFPAPTKSIPKPRIHWPGPKESKGVKDRDQQLEAHTAGSSRESSHNADMVPERRPGRSKNHQRQQAATQRRK